jgi:hypothetical protein
MAAVYTGSKISFEMDFFESNDNSGIIKNDNRDDSSQQFMDYLSKMRKYTI